MTGQQIGLLVVALLAAGGMLYVLRAFFKKLDAIETERWGQGRYESRLHSLILWSGPRRQKREETGPSA